MKYVGHRNICVAFYSSWEGMKQYIKNTVEGQAILDMIEDNSAGLRELLSLLEMINKLTLQLQSRNLDLCTAKFKIDACIYELRALPLVVDIGKIRDEVVIGIARRFPASEAAAMSVLKLELMHNGIVPDIVIKKVRAIGNKVVFEFFHAFPK